MAFPTPLITGTILFILVGFIVSFFGLFLKRTKRLDHNESQLFCVSIVVATVCVWMMWVCTWLHQWHPIIHPVRTIHAEGAH